MADAGFTLSRIAYEANVGVDLTYEKAIAHITHARPCVPDPFSQIVKKRGPRMVMELQTSLNNACVTLYRNGRFRCIAPSQDSARTLLEEAAMAIIGDTDSIDATFRFTGANMTYFTGVPVDLSVVAAHAHACGPSRLPHFQSLRINGRAVRVFSGGLLQVLTGTSVDDMKQTLLDACDILHASEGDINW